MNWLPFILIGGALAYPYIKTGFTLTRLNASLVAFGIDKFNIDNVVCYLILRLENPTSTSFIFQHVAADIELNYKKVGRIDNGFNMPVQARGAVQVKLIFTLDKNMLGSEFWNMIETRQTDFLFRLAGSVRANDKIFPLNLSWTMQKIQQQIFKPKATASVPDPVEIPIERTVTTSERLRPISREMIPVTEVSGIGAAKTVDQVVSAAWRNKNSGKEKIVNDTLHYGFGIYAYKKELSKSGVNYSEGKNSAFGHLTNKEDLQAFVEWLEDNDGYLEVE